MLLRMNNVVEKIQSARYHYHFGLVSVVGTRYALIMMCNKCCGAAHFCRSRTFVSTAAPKKLDEGINHPNTLLTKLNTGIKVPVSVPICQLLICRLIINIRGCG